ncbi:hypothetical protein Tco_0667154 [Tanacetum coccineum]
MLSPTGLKCSTSNCGSNPTCNKKNDRISQTPSRNMKNKVETQPRKVNKKNHVVKPIHDVDVKHSLLKANSELICATCKKSMFDGVHDMCLLDFVENVNSRRTFTIVGNSCPLTRITLTNVVPPKKTTSHSVETQKPELKVYSKKPKNVKNVGSSKKAKIVESKNVNHAEPNDTGGSNATDIPSSSSLVITGTVRFGNDHIARIIGYGDYQLGNVTISIVYYVEGLGYNLFSVGQFCDADLEVAFRKNTFFIRNLEGVDLLFGSRDTNLYKISLDDMLKTSSICLLSKASSSHILRDDDDDDEDEDEDEEEEEEHPAPADSVPPVHRMTARISIRDEPSISLPPREEVERLLALTTPPPSPLTPLSSPLPHIPSPPFPASPPASPICLLGYRAAMIRLRAETPSTSHPLPLPTSSPLLQYEIGESLAAATTRPIRGRRADYGFVGTMDTEIRRQRAEEVGYGIRDVWIDPREAVEEVAPMTLGGVNTRADPDISECFGIYSLMDSPVPLRDCTTTSRRLLFREAWGRSIEVSYMTHLEIMALRSVVRGQQAVISQLLAADHSDAPPPMPTSAPTSFPPLLLPSASHREDRPEVNLPPRKRLGIALGPGYEVGESSAATAARPAGGLRADYSFIATMDREIRRDPERYVGYGITDSWDEIGH